MMSPLSSACDLMASIAEPGDGPAHLCPKTGAFSFHCNNERRFAESGAEALAQYDDMVQALVPDRSDQPLGKAILPW